MESTYCLITRDRHRFWFNIWKTCNRPREGHIYECHKLAKKTYRTACRKAVNDNMNATYTKINLFFSKRDSKKLWNLIRVSKNKQNNFSENDIGIETYGSTLVPLFFGGKIFCIV